MNNNSNFYSSFPNSINKPIQSVKPTYDNFIIKPPDRNITHGHISEKFVVDSRDRDYIIYPNANNYKINVPEEYRDVVSVELALAQIPNSGYNITTNNNAFYIREDVNSIPFRLSITPGKYTDSSLIDELNGKHGDIFEHSSGLNGKYNFYHEKNTKKLRIQSNIEKEFYYNLSYNDGSRAYKCLSDCANVLTTGNDTINKIFGFKNKRYKSTKIDLSNYDITIYPLQTGFPTVSEYGIHLMGMRSNTLNLCLRKNLRKGDYLTLYNKNNTNIQLLIRIYKILSNNNIIFEKFDEIFSNIEYNIRPFNILYSDTTFDVECPDYIILDIPEFHKLDGNKESIVDSFAIIIQNDKCQTIINNCNISTDKEIKYYNPPNSRLVSFHVKFKRYSGELYDFNGQEHLLVFNITCLNQPGRYNNFVPKLSTNQ